MPSGWTVVEIPLGWGIYEGTHLIAHTALQLGLGKEEARAIAHRIITASDTRAALDEVIQRGTVQLSITQK